MKGPTHRHLASRQEESNAMFQEELAAKMKHLEGVREEHYRLIELFVDEMKDGDNVTIHYGPHAFNLVKAPVK